MVLRLVCSIVTSSCPFVRTYLSGRGGGFILPNMRFDPTIQLQKLDTTACSVRSRPVDYGCLQCGGAGNVPTIIEPFPLDIWQLLNSFLLYIFFNHSTIVN
jgi:hypothetical protein